MEAQPIHIPANFTDAGRFLGMFEVRNTVEALMIAVPIVFVFFGLLPFSPTVKIISCAVFLVPACGFALAGVLDGSLISFLQIYFKWRITKRRALKKRGESVEAEKA